MKKTLIKRPRVFVKSYFIDKHDIKIFSFLKDDINSLDCKDLEVVFHLSALVHQMCGVRKDKNSKVSIIQIPFIYGYEVKVNIKNLVNLVNKVSLLSFGNIQNKRSMVYIGNLCHLIDGVIIQGKTGIFLVRDAEFLITSKFIKLIAIKFYKKIYLAKTPFLETLLEIFKPSFHKKLYKSLKVNSTIIKEKLNLKNQGSVEYGIQLMVKG